MATPKRRPQRPPTGGGGGGPRRLGNQQPARPSSGAQRRYDRARKRQTNWIAWASVGVVIIIVVVLVIVRLTGSNTNTPGSASGVATGQDPALASSSYVKAVATIPASVFDSVGTAGEPVPFTVTKNQPSLTEKGLPRFVYVGAEFCPYCAVERYALVAALSRFGTFSNLHETSSGSSDGDIPTFSFYHSSYTSPYLVFSPYEEDDRQEPTPQPLVTPPSSVLQLYVTYDGNSSGQPATPFNTSGGSGIPFLDIANRYVSQGATAALYTLANSGKVSNGGPGRLEIAQAIHSPSSSTGKYLGTSAFIAEANYISAAVCKVDGGKPATVCSTSGVKAAAKALAAAKPVG